MAAEEGLRREVSWMKGREILRFHEERCGEPALARILAQAQELGRIHGEFAQERTADGGRGAPAEATRHEGRNPLQTAVPDAFASGQRLPGAVRRLALDGVAAHAFPA